MVDFSLVSRVTRGDTGVGILPDGYQWTNPLPQIPTKQSVPTSMEGLPGYFGLPILISGRKKLTTMTTTYLLVIDNHRHFRTTTQRLSPSPPSLPRNIIPHRSGP
jgi:hypothetical protein